MTTTTTNLNIQHDAGNHIFYSKVLGGNAELIYEKHADKYLDFTHTYVPEHSRGFGVAGTIVRFGLDFARQNQFKVKPTCPFVQDYLEKNPEHKDLLI